MNDVTVQDAALVMLAASMFFALIIERVMEVAKNVYDYLEVRNGWGRFWERRALAIRARLQNRLSMTKGNEIQRALVKYLSERYVSTDCPGYEGAEVISAANLKSVTVKGVSKVFGMATGIAIAFGADINVFQLIAVWTKTDTVVNFGLFAFDLPEVLQYTVTGVVMGLGAGTMHKFIAALERAKQKRESTQAA